MTLGEVVLQNPAAAEIFEDMNIDYFCRGNRQLEDALRERQVTLDMFAGELAQVAAPVRDQRPEPDWRLAPLRNLIKHIVDKHHTYLHSELPTLDKLVEKIVAENPGDTAPLQNLHGNVQRLRRESELHIRKEESILFPAIVELEASVSNGDPPNRSILGSVANVSRVLGQDHLKNARELAEIRALTNNYSHFPGGRLAAPALFRRLRALAINMHKHVHLENNVLFPRAVALERDQLLDESREGPRPAN